MLLLPSLFTSPSSVTSFGSNPLVVNRQEHILFRTKDTSSDYRCYLLWYVHGQDLLIGNMSHMRVVSPCSARQLDFPGRPLAYIAGCPGFVAPEVLD